MAAGETILYLSDGSQLSIYSDASVIGSPLHCSLHGTATSTSPYNVVFQNNVKVTDIICAAHPTAGVIDIFRNGQRGPKSFPVDARYLVSIANRKKFVPNIVFQRGVTYTFVPSVQTS